jgi:hypothetical protein
VVIRTSKSPEISPPAPSEHVYDATVDWVTPLSDVAEYLLTEEIQCSNFLAAPSELSS